MLLLEVAVYNLLFYIGKSPILPNKHKLKISKYNIMNKFPRNFCYIMGVKGHQVLVRKGQECFRGCYKHACSYITQL